MLLGRVELVVSLFHRLVPIPHTFISIVNRIKTETGTSIIIPPDDERSDIIRIEGDPKGVVAAKTMLLELAAKMVCKDNMSMLERCPSHFQKVNTVEPLYNGHHWGRLNCP